MWRWVSPKLRSARSILPSSRLFDFTYAVRRIARRHAGSGPVAQAVGVGLLVVAPKLDAVVPLDPTEVLGPIIGLVRTSGDRVPLHSANIAAIAQVVEIDVRDAEVRLVERTGVYPRLLGSMLLLTVIICAKRCQPKRLSRILLVEIFQM